MPRVVRLPPEDTPTADGIRLRRLVARHRSGAAAPLRTLPPRLPAPAGDAGLLLRPRKPRRADGHHDLRPQHRLLRRSDRKETARTTSIPARRCSRSAPRAATWAASSARTGAPRNPATSRPPARPPSPEAIAEAAVRLGCRSVAFTYNDPIVWAEYAIDTAWACRQAGVKTVAVTSGYINADAREAFYQPHRRRQRRSEGLQRGLLPHTDRRQAGAGAGHAPLAGPPQHHLAGNHQPDHSAGERFAPEEIERMCRWIVDELGADVPLHFSAFHPDFKLSDRGPDAAGDARRGLRRRPPLRSALRLHRQHQRPPPADDLLSRLRPGRDRARRLHRGRVSHSPRPLRAVQRGDCRPLGRPAGRLGRPPPAGPHRRHRRPRRPPADPRRCPVLSEKQQQQVFRAAGRCVEAAVALAGLRRPCRPPGRHRRHCPSTAASSASNGAGSSAPAAAFLGHLGVAGRGGNPCRRPRRPRRSPVRAHRGRGTRQPGDGSLAAVGAPAGVRPRPRPPPGRDHRQARRADRPRPGPRTPLALRGGGSSPRCQGISPAGVLEGRPARRRLAGRQHHADDLRGICHRRPASRALATAEAVRETIVADRGRTDPRRRWKSPEPPRTGRPRWPALSIRARAEIDQHARRVLRPAARRSAASLAGRHGPARRLDLFGRGGGGGARPRADTLAGHHLLPAAPLRRRRVGRGAVRTMADSRRRRCRPTWTWPGNWPAAVKGLQLDARPHRQEHAIEVQLPLLARLVAAGPRGGHHHRQRRAAGLCGFAEQLAGVLRGRARAAAAVDLQRHEPFRRRGPHPAAGPLGPGRPGEPRSGPALRNRPASIRSACAECSPR